MTESEKKPVSVEDIPAEVKDRLLQAVADMGMTVDEAIEILERMEEQGHGN